MRSLKAVRSRVAVSVWSAAKLRFFGISGWVRAYWTDAGKPNECGRRVGCTWQPLLDGRWLVALLCRGWCIWPVQRCHPRSISILHFITFLNTHHVDSALVLNPCFLLWRRRLFSLGVRSLNTVFFSFPPPLLAAQTLFVSYHDEFYLQWASRPCPKLYRFSHGWIPKLACGQLGFRISFRIC